MEILENKIYTFKPLETIKEAADLIVPTLISRSEGTDFSDAFKILRNTIKYSNRASAFNFNKKFHEHCNNLGIFSKEERQKLLDNTIYYYICNDMYDEKILEIEYLISMLGANINKKNEETNLSPYDYIQNSTSIGFFKRQSILRDLESLNPILEETREIIEKPMEFFDQNLSSFIRYLIEREEQQNTARNNNTPTPLPEGIFSENFEGEEAGAKTRKCLLI